MCRSLMYIIYFFVDVRERYITLEKVECEIDIINNFKIAFDDNV